VRARTSSFTSGTTTSASGIFEEWCLARMARAFAGANIRLQLWDGRSVALADGMPVATIVIRDRGTLVRLLYRTDLEFGEAYSAGRLDVQGDLVAALEAINRAVGFRPFQRRRSRARRIAPTSSRHNVHTHYDLGNSFYKLWLDEQMLYTCAYYESPNATLEEAQRAKMDHVCRKVRLRPGERVVEAGCGWGALALHMARHYGVTVRAYNISANQLDFARARATAEGLDDRVTFIDGDYRAIDDRADVFMSVGMLEHVGRHNYADLGAVIDRVIDPDHGRGLVHFIGRNAPLELSAWIDKHVFPGAYPPALSEVLPGVLESRCLSVTDIENLRLHYALTLKHWLARFEDRADTVREMFDESFVRTWRLYLAGSEAAFTCGDMQLFQVVFGRSRDNSQPWTRTDVYETRHDAAV
jgi:cyclopropane-fatty-acyl-phospholipid synthase